MKKPETETEQLKKKNTVGFSTEYITPRSYLLPERHSDYRDRLTMAARIQSQPPWPETHFGL